MVINGKSYRDSGLSKAIRDGVVDLRRSVGSLKHFKDDVKVTNGQRKVVHD